MAMRAAEKIVDGLIQAMEGFVELQQGVEEEFASENGNGYEGDKGSSEITEEVDAAIVTELRAAIESVMDSEDYGSDEIAALFSSMSDALEEIDPDVFEETEEEEEETTYEADAEDGEEYYDEDDLDPLEDDEEFDEDEDEDEEDE